VRRETGRGRVGDARYVHLVRSDESRRYVPMNVTALFLVGRAC
jgi:hypothetical protein